MVVTAIYSSSADVSLILSLLDHQKAIDAPLEACQVGRTARCRVLVVALVAETVYLRVVQPGQIADVDVGRLEKPQSQAWCRQIQRS